MGARDSHPILADGGGMRPILCHVENSVNKLEWKGEGSIEHGFDDEDIADAGLVGV
jgi:hypothetical protein